MILHRSLISFYSQFKIYGLNQQVKKDESGNEIWDLECLCHPFVTPPLIFTLQNTFINRSVIPVSFSLLQGVYIEYNYYYVLKCTF